MAPTQRAAQLALADAALVAPFSGLRPGDGGDERVPPRTAQPADTRRNGDSTSLPLAALASEPDRDPLLAAGSALTISVSKPHPTEFRP